MKLANRVALVTGGNRGIGLATARLFAAEGAAVILVARNRDRGEAAAAEVPGAQFIEADVAIADDCRRAVEETLRRHGGLDVLVNCAGILFRNRKVEETSEEEWDRTFAVNVKGTFLMSKYAMPALRERRGTIVNVSSYAGLVGYPNAAAYAASKAAIVNLTRSMALDHGREGVRVNAVCPGSVETEMLGQAFEGVDDVAATRRAFMEKHPLGRIASAEEVASTIVFLASDDSFFVTGVALPVDGGITAG
jgi:NAD(P)-dependent dehydrogenase (short-subunit alcohol dehydrogenase family)